MPLQWVSVYTQLHPIHGLAHAFGLLPLLLVLPADIYWAGRTQSSLLWLHDRAARGLLTGTAVVGCAYSIGNSFQYRFVFALLALPALWQGARFASGSERILCRTVLFLLPVYFWWDFFVGESNLNSALSKQLVCTALLIALTLLSLRVVRQQLTRSADRVYSVSPPQNFAH